MKGTILGIEKNLEETILNFLKGGLEKGCFDAVITPHRVPSGDSFAYLLINDKSILEGAFPLSPVIPVQGAKAISSLTRKGNASKKILVIMHPCEIRATIELLKLKQVSLGNLFLMSFDCPGVIPLSDYIEDPGKNDQISQDNYQNWEDISIRPICKICTEFSSGPADLHIGLLGADTGKMFLIPLTSEGERIMKAMDLKIEDSLDRWEREVEKLKKEREAKRYEAHEVLKSNVEGSQKLLETFSQCINCHNCMRVCPVCYCRQCYFDSDAFKLPPENFINRAKKKGSLRLPADTLLFHLGRMSHMILSCVTCGTCEDACPMSIPVSQVFSLVADRTQRLFNYKPGSSKEEPLPVVIYKEEELHDVEKPYSEIYAKRGEKNA
ncbi:MAG: 4Fe-4S dicluster domain-containing protein [Acidobacteriota bacterium]